MSEPIRIDTRAQLVEVATLLGVSPDWHEPDEQDVTAEVIGHMFDNAGFWPAENGLRDGGSEIHVALKQDGKVVAHVNLATLFAMAAGTVA